MFLYRIASIGNNQPVEQFIGIRDLSDTKAHTIVNEISSELTMHNQRYQNIINIYYNKYY